MERHSICVARRVGEDECMHANIPGLADVDNIDTVRASLPQVRLHVHLEILRAEMALGCQHHLNILVGGIECRRKVCGGHFEA